jgi:membrane protein implicated in regulation of membrane protease activity
MSVLSIPKNIELFSKTVGQVERTISSDRRGRVKWAGSFWPAELYHSDCRVTLLPAQMVNVVARRGITLLVTQ